MKKETLEAYLARGGKITVVPTRKAKGAPPAQKVRVAAGRKVKKRSKF